LTAAHEALDLARRPGSAESGQRFETVRHDAADEIADDDRALDALDALIDNFGIELPEVEDQKKNKSDEQVELEMREMRVGICRKALVVLARSLQVTTVVDFSDMCWLPVVLDLRVWAFDRVFIDETQDLSPCQIALVKRFVRPRGRILAVGDERQSIYQFRGADKDAIPGLVRALRARTLPLSITYRCPLSVVRLAQREVPELEAAPDAPEGVVDQTGTRERLLEKALVGDMVISRTNAPLIGLCLGLLKRGRRAAIMGRNIGEGLVKAIKDSKAKTVEALETYMEGWCAKEIARMVKKKRDPQEAIDKKDCVLALCEDAETVAEVLARADRLFTDKDGEAKVTLGTTHKLKGLEADRVWMLASTYRQQKGGEEANLWYVAVTRAKRELILTTLPKADGKDA
jgi:DNA helicase-2/ATP-dependent DNA helicase PcrA